MDAPRAFPPSPAFSDSDSLAGIDDLDAFLDSKGALSRWPTPPSRGEIVEDLEVPSEESDYDSEDGVDDLDIATVFARELGLDGAQAWDDILLIEDLLIRARLPIEVLALAFNILAKVVKQEVLETPLKNFSLDILIVSSMSLASIYTNDHPPSSSHWALNVAMAPVTGKHINAASTAIMSALDWRVHDCSDDASIKQAMRLFERRDLPRRSESLPHELYEEPHLKPQPLCLKIDERNGHETRWSNGQLTPGSQSSFSISEEPKKSFLPLL